MQVDRPRAAVGVVYDEVRHAVDVAADDEAVGGRSHPAELGVDCKPAVVAGEGLAAEEIVIARPEGVEVGPSVEPVSAVVLNVTAV